jgi:N-acetylglucosamine-6-phosphate deacetylase
VTRQVLTNCEVFDGETVRGDSIVIIDGETISAVRTAGDLPKDYDALVDLGGQLLAPGLVDLQVNGGGGVLFNDGPTTETLLAIGAAHREFGTTTFLPTLISDNADVMTRGIRAVNMAMREKQAGVIGIHLEGPHLNADYRGVHNASNFRSLNDDALALLTSLDTGRTLVTIAPETVSEEMIQSLCDAGVIVFGGHSAATYEETRQALDAGLAGFTHLFNAMTPLQSRKPGMVGAALEDDNSYVGIIADGHHVHPATLRLAIRVKKTGKCVLVTDAMPTVGTSDKSFVLDGETIRAKDGRCQTSDGILAGSDLGLIEAVRNTATFGGVDIYEALRMASCYPAEAIGLSDEIGFVRAGYRANLIALDDEFEVSRSWVAGEMALHR